MGISSIGNNGQQAGSALPTIVKTPALAARIEQNTQQLPGATPVAAEQFVAQAQKPEASQQALEQAVSQTNEFLKPINNAIQFSLDTESGKTIVKVVDLETKETIRQFPSEEMLAIAKAIDTMKGLLIQQKA